jgi:hypothetical protein
MKNSWNHLLPQNQPRDLDSLRAHLLANRSIKTTGCWEWTLSLSKSGYGKIKWRMYGDLRVHRVAAFLWLGFNLKDKRLICHKCDNPRCFNPEHLFIGTGSDNQKDSVRKRRHYLARKTVCKHGHPFSKENTYVTKNRMRHCRTCHRQRVLADYYSRKGVER